jgi:proteasome lid subunit RPN8/RPN11
MNRVGALGEAGRQRAAGFAVGFAVGAMLGYSMVERRQGGLVGPAYDPLSQTPAPPPAPVWRERSDVFRPGPPAAMAPSSALWIGPRGNEIGVSREALTAMERHVGSDVGREHVGLLLGRVTAVENRGCPTTHVDRAIPVRTSDASATHVVLTRESARDVAIALRDMPAGATVVGWFHSHPGLGVFLSGTDLRTQRDCFGAEWQIAVVLDPQRREIGVFAGPDGAPARRQTLA